MKIRQACLEDLDQVTALINATAKHLIDKDVFQWSYPCEYEEVKREIEQGEVYLLEDGRKLMGSYSIRPIKDDYQVIIEHGLYLYRIIIHPYFQGNNVGSYILNYLRDHHKKKENLILDCWAGNEKLKSFYMRNGCTLLGEFPEESYKICIFSVDKKH